MMTEPDATYDSEAGPIYQSEHSGSLFVLISRPEFGAGENAQVELEGVEDGEWYGVYQDNFRKGYHKVADTLADARENGEVDV